MRGWAAGYGARSVSKKNVVPSTFLVVVSPSAMPMQKGPIVAWGDAPVAFHRLVAFVAQSR